MYTASKSNAGGRSTGFGDSGGIELASLPKTSTLIVQRTLDPPSSERLIRDDLGAQDSTRKWPMGVRTGLLLVAAILILNSSVTLWASVSFPISNGVGILHVGDCEQIRKAGLALHMFINVISTFLLGASNFCMQCLSSPTREEVDARHTTKQWLETGVLSFGNLRNIDRRRVWLWLALALSSFPLHLMFNSAIFVNLTANRYTVVAVTESFVQNGTWTLVTGDQDQVSLIADIQGNSSDYEVLDFPDCIQAYGVSFLSGRRHVVVVTNSTSDNALLGTMDWAYDAAENSWVCGANITDDMELVPQDLSDYDCTVADALASLPIPFGDDGAVADRCLSEQVPDRCRLQFSLPIMFIVIACNAIKLVSILLTLLLPQATLITLGDAVSSFLEREDVTTRGMCAAGIADIKAGIWLEPLRPRPWKYCRMFCWQAVGTQRWVSCNVFALVACGLLAVLLYEAQSTTTTNPDLTTWWNLGFGAVTTSGLVFWPTPPSGNAGLMQMVLLANLPQLLLSALYVSYNQTYTCMSFADEWSSYFYRCQPLRVTRPRGWQRPTRFLTLPWRYMVPLMAVSAGCHFLLSQGFFLVSVSVFDEAGQLDTGQSLLTVGFSVIALVILTMVVGLVAVASFLMGFRRYRRGIPLAGPCSAAISAACHVAEFEDGWDTAGRPVQWGVTSTEGGVGHLAFSAGPVGEPIAGRLYL